MKTWTLEASGPLRGRLRVPGDKSISHRALMFNALASGPGRVRGLLTSEDVLATLDAIRQFGAGVRRDSDSLIITPPPALVEPGDVVDCGNSGTSIRLLAGIAAAQPFATVFTGDESLRNRPMGRIAKPLRKMGATVDGRSGGSRAPLLVRGATTEMVNHDLAVASAQVKSAILLAGLKTGVAVREPRQSRDHTERMLRAMGVTIRAREGWMVSLPADRLEPLDIEVPRDMSSAAFWLVAGAIVPNSEIYLEDVGYNPTRSGVVDALLAMGADVQVYPKRGQSAEPIADLLVRSGPLVGADIRGDLAVRCLDELPVLAVAAAFAEGLTTIADAAELRVKESDRIARVVSGLRSLGVEVEEREDGMVVEGGRPNGPAAVDASGDHRIAMAFAVAGIASTGGVSIAGAESVATSYPNFRDHLEVLLG